MTDWNTKTFKQKWEQWLFTVPDDLQISGYTAMRSVELNSVRHLISRSSIDAEYVRPEPIMPPQPEAAYPNDLGRN